MKNQRGGELMDTATKIVYLFVNDWEPSPREASKLCRWFLQNHYSEEEIVKEKLCVAYEIWDMSISMWITCSKDFIENKYPELLPYVTEKPQEPEYLEWKPENYGMKLLESEPEYDMADRVV